MDKKKEVKKKRKTPWMKFSMNFMTTRKTHSPKTSCHLESKMNLAEELQTLKPKVIKESCCRSYQLPKGRCFDCVEHQDIDPDEEQQ